MNTQDKLEFLAADVMRDVRGLVAEIDRATTALAQTRTIVMKSTEKQIFESVEEIKKAAQAITSTEGAVTNAATTAAKKILADTTQKMEELIAQEKEALNWIRRAFEQYKTSPPVTLGQLVAVSAACSVVSGLLVGFILK